MQTGDEFNSAPVIADANLDGSPELYCSSFDDNILFSINALSGKIIWQYRLLNKVDIYSGSAIAVGDISGDASEDFFKNELFQRGLKESFIEFESTESDKKLVVISPVFADDSKKGDKPIGVIISKMRTASIDNALLNRSGLGETGEVYIVNDNFMMLSESRFFEDAIFEQRVDTVGVQKCFNEGKEHGFWQSWYDDGKKKSEGDFEKGKMSGEWKGWYENEKENFIGNYQNELKEGLWKHWYPSGQMELSQNFSKGLAHGSRIYWFENGNKKEEGQYENGVKSGPWIFYHDNGNKQSECSFKKDRLDGPFIEYYEVGTKSAEKSYIEGMKDGKWTFYGKKEGEVLQTVKFKKGLKVQ